jgi:hypothetical protein
LRSDDHADARRAQTLGLIAAAAIAGAAAVYLLLVGTAFGQRLGDSVYHARRLLAPAERDDIREVLMLLTPATLLVGGVAIGAVALARRRVRLAVGVIVVVFGTAIIAEVLKAVLPRPSLGVDPPALAHNTAPSGHASIAMALVLAVIMVVPAQWRPAAAIGGFFAATFYAAGTLAAGWHRPADALMGELLALAVATAVCAILIARGGGVGMAADSWPTGRRRRAGLAIPVIIVVSALAAGLVSDVGSAAAWRFAAMSAAVDVLGLIVVLVLWRQLRDVDLGAPHRSP